MIAIKKYWCDEEFCRLMGERAKIIADANDRDMEHSSQNYSLKIYEERIEQRINQIEGWYKVLGDFCVTVDTN